MKKLIGIILIAVIAVTMFGACGKKAGERITDGPVQLRTPSDGDTIAVFNTSMGEFRAVLFPKYAPKAVENFVALAEAGYYEVLIFHRVEKDFVVQTGDPTGTGGGGESSFGAPFADEYSTNLHHFTGAIGMAKAADDNLKSQFYVMCGTTVGSELVEAMKAADFTDEICDAYVKNGGWPQLDNRYTVFAQVYEGLDVVLKINGVKVDSSKRPTSEVTLNSVKIETYSSEK